MLTVCMGAEPGSLFLYADNSVAARSIRQAIYDGPLDVLEYRIQPVILEALPNLEDGSAFLEPVSVAQGELIVDAGGQLANLQPGVRYLPSGCASSECAVEYAGPDPVQIDQLVARFRLLPNLTWSDGSPLTASDSVYAFEVAQALFPRGRSDLVSQTDSYTALDQLTVEWRGVPGYRHTLYAANFFTPLPRHAWEKLSPETLLEDEQVNRRPIGWGPYTIDEWIAGDHITLSKNAQYFRAPEGLPAFDKLVFRFLPDGEQALAAFLTGECDYLDESAQLSGRRQELESLQAEGRVQLFVEPGTAWEQVTFGIRPYAPPDESGQTPAPVSLFAAKETRQAFALCLDRQRLAESLFLEDSQVLDTYVPDSHPLYNAQVRRYNYDPEMGATLLQTTGWIDTDGDPGTPRQAQGVTGVPDSTPLVATLLTSDEPENTQAAESMQASLAACGIQLEVDARPWAELTQPGPEGPVFGRSFDLAQFAWSTGLEPPCFLYTSSEIPGPYPEFPKGWGGANAAGYSSQDYDRACGQAFSSLPGSQEHQAGHADAQYIFAEDLPALPLYARLTLVAARPDMCGIQTDPSAESALWNLESFDYGDGCAP